MKTAVVWLVGALLASACGSDTPSTGAPDGPPLVADAGSDGGVASGPATALFELPRSGTPPSEFYALPFPNDLRRQPDGTIDLSGLMPYFAQNPLLTSYLQIFSTKTAGFGTNEAIFFRFSTEIDPSALPSPADSVAAGASVYLVDVDPNSPHRGERVPLRFRFEKFAGTSIGADWLSCLPYPGFPLRRATTYAAVVTKRLHGADGTPVRRSADFDAVLAASGGDATVAAARTAYAPLVSWLGTQGADLAADVVDAAVFTTQDPVTFMQKIRQVIYSTVAAPVAKNIAATDGTSGYQTYEGQYDTPNFQSGLVPYTQTGGEILVDESGDPIVDHMETIRFAVTVPKTTMPASGWPIVLYAHGTGGDYRSFIDDGTAGRLAAQGLAIISIDQVLHGPRDPTHSNPDFTFFNPANPLAARDNVRQGALDDFQLLRLVATLSAGGQTFDEQKIGFFGHSQGGLTGPPFLAAEPNVTGAVLSGAGGLIYIALLDKTEPPIIPTFVMATIRDVPLDEFNATLALIQMFIEPADPANYGPLLIREPLEGVGAKNIYQSEGFVDHYAPDPGIEAFGVAMGLTPATPMLHDVPGFALRGTTWTAPPIMSNLDGKTAVFAQYDAGAGEGHFVVFDVAAAQRQSAQFLGTLAKTGTATLVP